MEFSLVQSIFGWLPMVIRVPVLALIALLSLLVLVKVVGLILSLIVALFDFINPFN